MTACSWGPWPPARAARELGLADRAIALPAADTPSGLLAHGLGRSYGNVALNDSGTLLLTRGLDRFIAFDRASACCARRRASRSTRSCSALCRWAGSSRSAPAPASLGNLKPMLAGTFHALKFSKYGADYLGAFAYRFNRRFDLRGLIARSIVDVDGARRSQGKQSKRDMRRLVSNQETA